MEVRQAWWRPVDWKIAEVAARMCGGVEVGQRLWFGEEANVLEISAMHSLVLGVSNE